MEAITYTEKDGYLIPDLIAPGGSEASLGRYAGMHRDYLEKEKRVVYADLLITGRLNESLHRVEKAALSRLEQITGRLAKKP